MGGWEAASAGEVGGVGVSSVAVGVPMYCCNGVFIILPRSPSTVTKVSTPFSDSWLLRIFINSPSPPSLQVTYVYRRGNPPKSSITQNLSL